MVIWDGQYAIDFDVFGNSWVLRDADGKDLIELSDDFMLRELESLYDSTEGFCMTNGRVARLLMLDYMAEKVSEVNPWLMGMFVRAALTRGN